MEKELVLDELSGEMVSLYPRDWYMRECIEYLHKRQWKAFIGYCWQEGKHPDEAKAELRAKYGVKTQKEAKAEWEAKLEAWRIAREAKAAAKRPVGRPAGRSARDVPLLSLQETKAILSTAILQGIAKAEGKPLAKDARELLDGIKRHLLTW